MRITRALLGVATLTAMSLTSLSLLMPAPTEATAGPKGHRKVTICHATSSHNKPYTKNHVDKSSVDEVNNKHYNGHGDHDGPVWHEGIAGHWGDIIPPFTNDAGKSYPGKNWTAEGKSIYDNKCKPVKKAETPAPKPENPTPTTPTTTPGGNGAGQVLGTTTTASTNKEILAETGTPMIADLLMGASVIGTAAGTSLLGHKKQ